MIIAPKLGHPRLMSASDRTTFMKLQTIELTIASKKRGGARSEHRQQTKYLMFFADRLYDCAVFGDLAAVLEKTP